MINVILQFLELDLVNINVSEVYQNIPVSSRDKDIFTFLTLGKASTDDK